jgi:NosR/NirI family transcriptional regulator, nitrous oxide reductase regulator
LVQKVRKATPYRQWIVHALRLSVLLCILLLFQAIHQRVLQRNRNVSFGALAAETIEAIFGKGCQVTSVPTEDSVSVIDQDGKKVGYVVQTSPASDQSVGFSGPTNVLVAFETDGRVRRVSILQSGDTRDHIKLIESDPLFFRSFEGKTANQLRQLSSMPPVTGATLSSAAIIQGIQRRFGASIVASKFDSDVTVSDARRFFEDATSVTQDTSFPSLWFAIDDRGRECGWLLRTSPVAEDIVGYQGPTDALIAMNTQGQIVGMNVGESFDNEPYVGYVRKDGGFRAFWSQFDDRSLAKANLKDLGMEGVSGATMSSMAIAESIVKAANELEESKLARAVTNQSWYDNFYRAIGTAVVIGLAIAICFSHWRGNRWVRTTYQLVVIGYLGFLQGEVLSVAMIVGWAQNGVPWRSATGLLLLTIAALILPIATKRNVYCSHLCPHGAVQQLLPRRWQWKSGPSPSVKRLLEAIRPVLLLWVLCVVAWRLPFGLVEIEPFDAYAWRAAALASIVIAIGGLILSLFIPMGYCRYGCVTGGLLNYLRRSPDSTRLQRADYFSAACLVTWCTLYFFDLC